MNNIKEIIKKNKTSIGVLLCILYVAIGSTSVSASAELFVSEEVGPNDAMSRDTVDTLDDQWLESLNDIGVEPGQIETAQIEEDTTDITELLTTNDGTLINVSLQDVANPSDLSDQGTPAATQGKAGSAASTSLQGSAPKPTSLADQTHYNEVSGSSQSRNGLLFSFSQEVTAFGAYFGDIETRTDGEGVAGAVRLYGRDDLLISSDILQTSTIDQSLCGAPVDDTFAGCGNNTTRWIGFVDPTGKVGKMLVIVGDDDSSETASDGNAEHLSATGFAVVTGTIEIAESAAEAEEEVEEQAEEVIPMPEFDVVETPLPDTSQDPTPVIEELAEDTVITQVSSSSTAQQPDTAVQLASIDTQTESIVATDLLGVHTTSVLATTGTNVAVAIHTALGLLIIALPVVITSRYWYRVSAD